MKRILLTVAAMAIAGAAQASDVMKMAVTTSFHNSGLAEVLLPEIQKDLDLEVQLLVVGTGQAIKLGQAGDVDAILVHSRAAEEAFVEGGYGTHRREIMYNDFVVIGPAEDPAAVADATSAADALQKSQAQRPPSSAAVMIAAPIRKSWPCGLMLALIQRPQAIGTTLSAQAWARR
jgi:tungstate transport system substrate-binding protein